MRFVQDPVTALKINRMHQRVRWQDPLIREREIDQTQLVLNDGGASDPSFSFLVMGDTGSSRRRFDPPQRRIAQRMLEQSHSCRFVLHTGDVVYMTGSSEQYLENFIKPYQGWLLGGEDPQQIPYDQMVFTFPVLPVLGNHDYYDLPWIYGLLVQLTWPLRWATRFPISLDLGWHGSFQGDAYARAFLDYLGAYTRGEDLTRFVDHLDRHYIAKTEGGRCLQYTPGQFTRLPNRYYSFHYGGIDFFALDSNTFNSPLSWGSEIRQEQGFQAYLQQEQQALAQRRGEIFAEITHLGSVPDRVDQLDELYAELEQLQEIELDLDKQKASLPYASGTKTGSVDVEQLTWLKERLIQSWRSPSSRGRVIYLHHPPYVTETSKWNQAQTLAVRYRLRQVLDQVQTELGGRPAGRALVDLVFTGHAHCLEHLQTVETGHGDAGIHWIICGGSGFSLRRQRWEDDPEADPQAESGSRNRCQLREKDKLVAESQLFVGRTGHGSERRRSYTFLRVDVLAGDPPQFRLCPYVLERYHHTWRQYDMDPIGI